jgi:hypothetical protein
MKVFFNQKYISFVKLNSFLILLVIVKSSIGQTNIAYKGNFNSVNFKGIANYWYFENENQERVYNGNFSFRTKDNIVRIEGGYHNGKKHGKWNTTYLNNDPKSIYTFKSFNITGYYDNGNLTGKWILNKVQLHHPLSNFYDMYFGITSNITKAPSRATTEICTVSFKDNKFSGYFEHKITGKYSTRVLGKFNNDGFFDSTWTISYYEDGVIYKIYREYNNGYLLSIRKKNTSSGDIETLYNSTINGSYYLGNPENGFEFKEDAYSLLKDAIFTWFNDTDYSDLYEVKKGANFLDTFPERIVHRQ